MLQLLSFSKKSLTNSLSIYVKSNTGNTLSVELDPKWDIKDVKEFVAPQLGLEPTEMKIIFAGKELSDSTKLEVSANQMELLTVSILTNLNKKECDLGQRSILHAVKARRALLTKESLNATNSILEESAEEHEPSKPLSQTMTDLQLGTRERKQITKNGSKFIFDV